MIGASWSKYLSINAIFSLNWMGFAVLSAASSSVRPSFFSASGTDLSALSAAISFLICSGGSVNFFVCGSMPDMIVVIFINTASYWAMLARPCFLTTSVAYLALNPRALTVQSVA